MEPTSQEKSLRKPEHCISYKEKSYYEYDKELCNFLSSKFEAMEKMNLNDECIFEDELESKKISANKNILSKSKDSKHKKTEKKHHEKKQKIKIKILLSIKMEKLTKLK